MRQRTYTITLSEQEAITLERQCAALNAFERAIAEGWEGFEASGFTPEAVVQNIVSLKLEDWRRHHQQIRQKCRRA